MIGRGTVMRGIDNRLQAGGTNACLGSLSVAGERQKPAAVKGVGPPLAG
jgi:hypothetical protein